MNATLLMLSIILLLIFLVFRMNKPNKMMKSNTKKFAFRISKAAHFKILIGFLGLLLLLSAIGEFVGAGNRSVDPAPLADANFDLHLNSIDSQIFNRETVDPSLLVEKRTHSVGETLTIHNKEQNEDYSEGPTIYIERKSGNDQTIEEFIYKQLLIEDGYDFSDKIHATTPIWTSDTMTLLENQKYDITYTAFQEATFLNQLTKSKSYNKQGFGSFSGSPIIHLKIPQSLEVINEYEEEQLIYIDEFD